MLLQQLFNIVLFPWPSFGALCIDGNCEEFMQCDEQSGLLEAGGYTCVLTRGTVATEELQCPNGSFLLAQLAYGTNIRRPSCHTNHVTNENNKRKESVSESLKPGDIVTFTLTTTSSSTWFGITVENPEITSLDIYVQETENEIPLQHLDYNSSKGSTGSYWNTAERCPNLANRTFTLEVVLGENDFQVSVDGNVLFNHEVPKEFQTETMNTLTVTGDVQIKSIYIN